MQRIILSSLLVCSLIYTISAQNIPLESWRTHFSYRQAKHLSATPDKIFCATDNGLFYYDFVDNSINVLSKLDGLSDVNISALGYSAITNTLVIGYSSGGIDLVKEDGIYEIDDFKRSNLVPEKDIKDIKFWKNNALIATALGVIVISIPNNEITENYRSIGSNGDDISVAHLYVKNDTLYVISNQGIQSGSLHENLLDFNNWKQYPETQTHSNSFFGSISNSVYSIKNDSILIKLENGVWSESGHVLNDKVRAVRENIDFLYLGTNSDVFQFNGSSLTDENVSSNVPINDFLVKDGFWLASEGTGLVRNSSQESIFPNGPISDHATNVVATDGIVYLLYGPDPTFYQGESDQLGYNLFDGNSWTYQEIQDFYNLTDVAKWRETLYFSSLGSGIYSLPSGSIIDHTNSTLTNSKNGYGPLITDLNSGQNLWMASFNNPNPIAGLDSDDVITNYSEAIVGTDSPGKIVLSFDGPLLIQNSTLNGGGMIAFDPPNEQRIFTTASNLPANQINSLIIDQEDGAWLGTTNGLVTFPDASYIFEFPQPVNPVYENSLLFEDDEIYALAADGGNRIWISTREGLWVFNDSFTEIVHFFTEENSPLPSNEILQLEYNAKNGEMFIQTIKGLVSFRSSSSRPRTGYKQVSIFPNPVRPGYSGLVGITGLEYNTLVKITTIDGKLIKEIATNGGTASWDLLDYNNRKVESGVYIVFTASNEGSEKFVGKIAIVN